jgi:hypothetical protein
MTNPLLALDRSLRSLDRDQRLHVESCNISKAMVCGYKGREIPDYETLGLDPKKTYQLYRDPIELRAAAQTFKNMPLMLGHVVVSAENPEKESIVGTIGTDARFEYPYLKASIAVWDQEAIDLIESRDQEQISCGYYYKCDLTPGQADGISYDGVMRNLQCNHVALVPLGRAGPDVVVSDSLPEVLQMKFPKVIALLKPYLAQDADLEALDAELGKAAKDEKDEKDAEEKKVADKKAADKKAADKKAADAKRASDAAKDAELEDKDDDDDDTKKRKAADRKARDAKRARDADDPDHRNDFNSAKDAITQDQLDAAVAAGVKLAQDRMSDLHAARAEVEPICGVVALDSADEVRAFALKHLNVVDLTGVPPSAYKALLAVAKQKPASARIAADAALASQSGTGRVASIWPISARRRA